MNVAPFHKGTVKFSAQNLWADCKHMLFVNKKVILSSLQWLKSGSLLVLHHHQEVMRQAKSSSAFLAQHCAAPTQHQDENSHFVTKSELRESTKGCWALRCHFSITTFHSTLESTHRTTKLASLKLNYWNVSRTCMFLTSSFLHAFKASPPTPVTAGFLLCLVGFFAVSESWEIFRATIPVLSVTQVGLSLRLDYREGFILLTCIKSLVDS